MVMPDLTPSTATSELCPAMIALLRLWPYQDRHFDARVEPGLIPLAGWIPQVESRLETVARGLHKLADEAATLGSVSAPAVAAVGSPLSCIQRIGMLRVDLPRLRRSPGYVYSWGGSKRRQPLRVSCQT
jgi:hypothetical protein